MNFLKLTSIQAGGALSLPVILIGWSIGKAHGFYPALFSILCGNALLTLLGCYLVKLAVEEKLNTSEQARAYFGDRGVAAFSLALLVVMAGWFAIQLNVMTDLLKEQIPPLVSALLFGILLIGVTLRGLDRLSQLAFIAIPITAVCLVIPFFATSLPLSEPFSFHLGGLSLVMAGSAAAIIDLPTFFKEARSLKEGLCAVILVFFGVLSGVEVMGAYFGAQNKEMGEVFGSTVPLLLMAGFLINALNLYSAAVNTRMLFKVEHNTAVIAIAILGVIFSLFNPLDYFEVILNGMGRVIASLSGILVTAYFFKRKEAAVNSLLSGMALCGGILCPFFEIPMLDSYFWALLIGVLV